MNTQDYRIAPGGDGPLANQWKDKPHRLVYDLCTEVERLQGQLDFIQGHLERCKIADDVYWSDKEHKP